MILSSKRFARVGLLSVLSGVKAWCAIANENISGKTLAPKCSNGILNVQSPLLPPTIDGDADISNACLSLNGCGRDLETQSMIFLRFPGMEPLYSGDEIIKASLDKSLFRNCSAPAGCEPSNSRSWLNEGQSNSLILAKSTFPPLPVITVEANFASFVLREFFCIEAENTRKDIG